MASSRQDEGKGKKGEEAGSWPVREEACKRIAKRRPPQTATRTTAAIAVTTAAAIATTITTTTTTTTKAETATKTRATTTTLANRTGDAASCDWHAKRRCLLKPAPLKLLLLLLLVAILFSCDRFASKATTTSTAAVASSLEIEFGATGASISGQDSDNSIAAQQELLESSSSSASQTTTATTTAAAVLAQATTTETFAPTRTTDAAANNDNNDILAHDNSLLFDAHTIRPPTSTLHQQQQRSFSQLERRIDRLEFELRKSVHQLRNAGLVPHTGNTGNNVDSGGATGTGEQQHNKADGAQWAADLSARLELMEKYIAVASTKLYETEQRVKRLDRCECRLSCKWTPPAGVAKTTPPALANSAPATETAHNHHQPNDGRTRPTNSAGGGQEDDEQEDEQEENVASSAENNGKQRRLNRRLVSTSAKSTSNTTASASWLLKADGEVWQSKCDVCSCHRGRVRCRYMSCPEPKCEEPQHVAGKCCPVCYKSCVYKAQTVRHGNKLVINSGRDTCKECMCIDGRFKCQRVEVERSALRLAHTTTEAEESGGVLLAAAAIRRQRSTPMDLAELAELAGASQGAHLLAQSDYYDDVDDDRAEAHTDAGRQLLPNNNNNSTNMSGVRRRRHNSGDNQTSQASANSEASGRRATLPPLVCPQIDCKPEEQVRLENDCCTYCRNFDFCAQKSWHQCHPSAFCINNMSAAIAAAASTSASASIALGGSVLTLRSAPFSCHCRAGFVGDGRHCRDIDECSQRQLNACEPKTSNCVNLPGSYECKCRRGFKPAPQQQQHSEASWWPQFGANSTQDGQQPTGQLEQQVALKCVDVNECADGKLNRCHPQAKCVNLRGSYKCHCKRGYLGNGFECHKWFSSGPDVAAYLHRHAASDYSPTGEQAQQSQSQSQRRPAQKRVNLPLGALDDDDDPDEDRMTRTRPPLNDERDEDDADSNGLSLEPDGEDEDSDEADERQQRRHPPKLSESKWEPLRFEESAPISQQSASTNSGQQAAPINAVQVTGSDGNTGHNGPGDDLDLIQQASTSLNTRTMFFQLPPPLSRRRWQQQQQQWQENVTSANVSLATILPQTSELAGGASGQPLPTTANNSTQPPATTILGFGHDNGANYGESDTNDPVYIQRSSKTVYQHDQRQTTSLVNSNGQQANQATRSSQLPGSITQLPNNFNNANNNSPGVGYKRGTIIASATTSPTRGHGHRVALTSSAQYHKSRALGVTSSASQQSPGIREVGTFSQSYLVPVVLIISLTRIYCIDLNHVVTFYFN